MSQHRGTTLVVSDFENERLGASFLRIICIQDLTVFDN